MSVNIYNKQEQTLSSLASNSRVWIGTKAAHDKAVEDKSMPDNVIVYLTDDYPQNDGDISDIATFSDKASNTSITLYKQGHIVTGIATFRLTSGNLPTTNSPIFTLSKYKPTTSTWLIGILYTDGAGYTGDAFSLSLDTSGQARSNTSAAYKAGYYSMNFTYYTEDEGD